MICVMLAAGLGTRMYPLTLNCPKALLPLKEGVVIDRLVMDIAQLKEIRDIYIITNNKFKMAFQEWSKKKINKLHIISNQNQKEKLSKGIIYTLSDFFKTHKVEEVLLIASDNILEFSLSDFIAFYKSKKYSCVMYHYEDNIERLRSTGVANIKDELVIDMQEKPRKPLYNSALPPFYIYTTKDIKSILKLGTQGIEVESMGTIVAILHKMTNIYAYKMPGNRVDIGTIQKYKKYIEEMNK